MNAQNSDERSIEIIEQKIEQEKRRALELQLSGWQRVAHAMLDWLPAAAKDAGAGKLGPMRTLARFFKVSQPTGPLIEQIMAHQVMIQETLEQLSPPELPIRLVHDVPRPDRTKQLRKPTDPLPSGE